MSLPSLSLLACPPPVPSMCHGINQFLGFLPGVNLHKHKQMHIVSFSLLPFYKTEVYLASFT